MKTEPNEPIGVGSETIYYGSEDQFSKIEFYPGLTKREYFSAMALQGLLANPKPGSIYKTVELAIESADYLINALNATE